MVEQENTNLHHVVGLIHRPHHQVLAGALAVCPKPRNAPWNQS